MGFKTSAETDPELDPKNRLRPLLKGAPGASWGKKSLPQVVFEVFQGVQKGV